MTQNTAPGGAMDRAVAKVAKARSRPSSARVRAARPPSLSAQIDSALTRLSAEIDEVHLRGEEISGRIKALHARLS